MSCTNSTSLTYMRTRLPELLATIEESTVMTIDLSSEAESMPKGIFFQVSETLVKGKIYGNPKALNQYFSSIF